MPPIRLGQIAFSFTSHGIATGYVVWAYLTDEVAAEVAVKAGRTLQLGEWNEGTRLWIMDVVAPFGNVAALLRVLRPRLQGHDRAWTIRSDRPGALVRTHQLAPIAAAG